MNTITVEAVAQPFGVTDVIRIALCLVILAAAIWHARRERQRRARASFSVRVLLPALAIAVSVTLLASVQGLGSGAEGFVMTLFMLLLVGLFSLLLMLVIEAIAWRLRPVRTAHWLGGALLLFIGCFHLAPFGLLVWLNLTEARVLLDWEMLELATIVAAGALIWWSCLPPRPASLRGVFE